jgi:PAS domain S-box-containing protein
MATTYESGGQRRLSEGDGGTRAETLLAAENPLLEMIAALQESEERFRCMADSISEVIWITQLEPERVLYASPSFERIWGRPLAELYRDPRLWTETIHPDDRARVENTFSRWIAGEDVDYHDVEFRIVQPNGATRWIHERGVVSLNAHGKPYRVSGISTDITEAKLAADALRRSEAYLTEAQRLSRTGSFGWCPSSGEIHWSDETFRIFACDRASQPSIALVLARTHPDDRGDVEQTIERALRDGEDFDIEHRLQMPDGSIKHVHVVAHAIKNEWADLELVGAVSDVTTAKVAEERIRQDEREFRQIVEAIPALILVLSPDGSPFYANQVLLEYTGLTLADVQAKDLRERIFHPEDAGEGAGRTSRRPVAGRTVRSGTTSALQRRAVPMVSDSFQARPQRGGRGDSLVRDGY